MDKDSKLSKYDLAYFLGIENVDHEYITEMIQKVDDDSNAQIDFQEFSQIMEKIK